MPSSYPVWHSRMHLPAIIILVIVAYNCNDHNIVMKGDFAWDKGGLNERVVVVQSFSSW